MNQEVWVVVPGAGDDHEGRLAVIEQDTTAADLLQAANLNPNQYQLQIKRGEEYISLGSQDRVADHVSDGGKVFAIPPMVVG